LRKAVEDYQEIRELFTFMLREAAGVRAGERFLDRSKRRTRAAVKARQDDVPNDSPSAERI
jgi:hypothetical protein